jgi:hypothetical protein
MARTPEITLSKSRSAVGREVGAAAAVVGVAAIAGKLAYDTHAESEREAATSTLRPQRSVPDVA